MRRLPLAIFLILASCVSSHGADGDGDLTIGADGWSDVLHFEVPAGAATMTIVMEGDDPANLALGSLRLSDGVEQIADFDLGAVLASGAGIAGSAPNLVTVMQGTSAFQYPTLATQSLPAGPATLRVRSDRGGTVRVSLFFGSGTARMLRIGLVSFAGPLGAEPQFVERAAEILAAAGITLVVDEIVEVEDRGPVEFGPFPRPGDSGAALFEAARRALGSDALPVIVADIAADGRYGHARGLPAPPIPASHRRAVVIDPTADPATGPDPDYFVGRILGHELGHALGLLHPVGYDVGGAELDDGLADTFGFDDTLMGSALIGAPISESSVRLSPQQAFAMTRSALLE